MLKRLLPPAVALALAGLMLTPSAASAAPGVGCQQTDPWTGVCLVWVQAEADARTGNEGAETVSGTLAVDTNPCTYQLAEPQPANTNPVWAGHTSADGAIWMHICPTPLGLGTDDWIGLVFLPNGVAPANDAPVDPRLLARQAIASMVMRAPEIRTALRPALAAPW